MLMSKGARTFSEILEQPDRWVEAIKLYNKERDTLIWIKKMRFEQLVFTGCGASYAASILAANLFSAVGKIFSTAIHAADLLVNDTTPFDIRRKTLVIPISESGDTDELIWALEKLRKLKPDIDILSTTCNNDSPVSKLGTKSWNLDFAKNDGLIAVKSFSSILYVLSLAAGAIGGNAQFLNEMSKLPKNIDIKVLHNKLIKMRHLADLKATIFCGAGYCEGLARYGSLILKEMSITPSYYIHPMEFRHGHYVAVAPNTMFFYLLSEKNSKMEVEAMRDAAKMKAQIFLLGEKIDTNVEAGVEYSIKYESGLSPYAQVFHAIPTLQLIAFQHAITKGMNPDKPKHLTGTVKYKNKPEE